MSGPVGPNDEYEIEFTLDLGEVDLKKKEKIIREIVPRKRISAPHITSEINASLRERQDAANIVINTDNSKDDTPKIAVIKDEVLQESIKSDINSDKITRSKIDIPLLAIASPTTSEKVDMILNDASNVKAGVGEKLKEDNEAIAAPQNPIRAIIKKEKIPLILNLEAVINATKDLKANIFNSISKSRFGKDLNTASMKDLNKIDNVKGEGAGDKDVGGESGVREESRR